MIFQDVINAITADCSGYAAAKKLGITPSTFYKYKNGSKLPSDETLDKMAELTSFTPQQVYLAAYAERLENTEVAKAFRHLAA
jgi:transcriptional regulator with XRE-family HTH domain